MIYVKNHRQSSVADGWLRVFDFRLPAVARDKTYKHVYLMPASSLFDLPVHTAMTLHVTVS